jgi:hypothetical protein
MKKAIKRNKLITDSLKVACVACIFQRLAKKPQVQHSCSSDEMVYPNYAEGWLK